MAKIIGESIKNIPWQEKPEGYRYPVWRYSGNPIITRDNLYMANSIFNSAVVPFGDGFAGVFRVDVMSRDHTLVVGYSKDAINWELEEKVIFRGYDPRLCLIDGKYYLSWVNLTPHGTTIGIAYTTDFKEWVQLEDACYPVARNGVLFPRKVNDEYLLLIRPCDRGHTPYGDIFLSHSKDLTYWGKHRFVMKPVKNWEMTKVGAGPTPIETDEGWLMFYHGVLTSCTGFTYAMGAAILDNLIKMSPGRFSTEQTASCLLLTSFMNASATFPTLFSPAQLLQTAKQAELQSITVPQTQALQWHSQQLTKPSIS